MRKLGPLSNSNRVTNYQALAVVMLTLDGHKRRIDNQRLIEATKKIWPMIGHKTSSDYIDMLVDSLCHERKDCFDTFRKVGNNTLVKRKLTKFGIVEAYKALDVLNPEVLRNV